MTVHMSLRVTGEKFIHLHQLARWPLEWRQVRKTGWHNSPGYGVWIYNSSFLFVVYNDFFLWIPRPCFDCFGRERPMLAFIADLCCQTASVFYPWFVSLFPRKSKWTRRTLSPRTAFVVVFYKCHRPARMRCDAVESKLWIVCAWRSVSSNILCRDISDIMLIMKSVDARVMNGESSIGFGYSC